MNHLDLFVTDKYGVVWSTWRDGYNAPLGWQPWFRISADEKFAPGAPVTAVWRAGSDGPHLDLFVTDKYGVVWSTWWESQVRWQKWFRVYPIGTAIMDITKFASAAEVTALWRQHTSDTTPDHLDLFVTGADGAVWSTWWEASRGWQRWFLVYPPGTDIILFPGASVAAVWSFYQDGVSHLDLFVTRSDGAVWSTWFDGNQGWQRWFPVYPPNTQMVLFASAAPVSAQWHPGSSHLDLFVSAGEVDPETDAPGAVWSAWWQPNLGWQKWFPVYPAGSNVVPFSAGASVSADWRWTGNGFDHLDLFVSGSDGAVWSTWFEYNKGWQKWFPINPPNTPVIQFTPGCRVCVPYHLSMMELFAVDRDGKVQSAWWENAGWHGWYQPGIMSNDEPQLAPRTSVTGVWRLNPIDIPSDD